MKIQEIRTLAHNNTNDPELAATTKIPNIRTFGRRHGKKLSAHQANLINNLLPGVSPKTIRPANKNIILEIGFGGGEHLRDIAHAYPDHIIIGAEPFINGVASLMSSIVNSANGQIKPEYKNIYIWPDDVRKILERDSDDFIDLKFSQIYILHPDPWPKARHEKRRLLNAEFLNMLSSRLTTNGQIIIGTDHHEYYNWIVNQLPDTNIGINTTNIDIIKTRYQQKNKAKTDAPRYLVLSSK